VSQPAKRANGGQTSAAVLFQKWAEMFKRQSETDASPAMKWLLAGAAMSAEMCATEMRERADPTVDGKPDPAAVNYMRDSLRSVLQIARREDDAG
jgi:hypothetical protein